MRFVQAGLLSPLPRGWLLVKDEDGKIWWVNQDLNEVSEDPPNLDELIDNFQRAKNKSRMMEKRGEDEKKNARKKILRNIPDPDDDDFGTIRQPAKKEELKKSSKAGGGQNNKKLMSEGGGFGSGNYDPLKGSSAGRNKRQGREAEEDAEQTTDPKMKRGVIEDSIGSFEFGLPGENDFLDEDPYKYTKSTLKKGNEDGASPYAEQPKRKAASPNILLDDEQSFSIAEKDAEMPILEMNLDLDDLGDELDGHFITPSGKKNEPVKNKKKQGHKREQQTGGLQTDKDQYQMVDSNVLERMINDIKAMQMKMSTIEQDNSQLKRKNIELVNEQKKIKERTSSELKNTRKDLENEMKEKENRIQDLLKEELKKKEGESASLANLNIQKDIQGIKELLQNSVMRNTQPNSGVNGAQNFGPNKSQPSPGDIQSSLPVVDSQVMPQGANTDNHQNAAILHHSFGAGGNGNRGNTNTREQDVNGNIPQGSGNIMMSSMASPHFGSGVIIKPPGPPSSVNQQHMHIPNNSTSNNNRSSSTVIVQKWIEVIYGQKEFLRKIKAELSNRKILLEKKKLAIKQYELEMNNEVNELGLDKKHSLVSKIKKNIRGQINGYKDDQKGYQDEINKYRMRQNNVGLLEKTFMYLQGMGPVGSDADKHLEEIYTTLKAIEHFSSENNDVSKDSLDPPSMSSHSQNNSEEVSMERGGMELEANEGERGEVAGAGFAKKNKPVLLEEEEKAEGEVLGGEGVKEEINPSIPVFTETIELNRPLNQTPKSKPKANRPQTVYFNEFEKTRESVPGRSRSGLTGYPEEFGSFKGSMGYFSPNRPIAEDTAKSNIRRYLQSQSRWYADMRGEVGHI